MSNLPILSRDSFSEPTKSDQESISINIIKDQSKMSQPAGQYRLNLADSILQITSHSLYLFCLFFFIFRLWKLRRFSMTNKYLTFFPRLRVLLSLLYIILSGALFIYTLSHEFYRNYAWVQYFLGGGGGQFCINSLVLVFQLLVLRQQLLKQKHFTRWHIVFFTLLAISSTIRLIEVILDLQYWPYYIEILPFQVCLAVNSWVLLGYWLIKLKSLPIFPPSPKEVQLQDILIRKSEIIDFMPSNKILKLISDDFPYLLPSVSIENGEFRVTLESYIKHSDEHRRKVMTEQTFSLPTSFQRTDSQFVAVTIFTREQLAKFYISCGKFPLKTYIDLEKQLPQQLAFSFQTFLEQLLLQKKYYRQQILKQLHIPPNYIQNYQTLHNISELQEHSSFDRTFGVKLIEDHNAIYFSIQVFKHLWVSTHYLFYIRVVMAGSQIVTYPIIRYSELEDELKKIIKINGKSMILPAIPKKQLFHWNQDEFISKRKYQIDKYLKRLTNDCTLIKIPQARMKILQFFNIPKETELVPQVQDNFYCQIKITKGQITKLIIKNECVTFYEFKIFREDVELKTIRKRYSQFDELHQDVKRWMNNIKITFTFLEMPQKVYFGSESLRHEKLNRYLQNLVDIKGIGRVYAVNAFFNVGNNQEQRYSETSEIQEQSRQKQQSSKWQIELPERSKSKSSSNFSHILEHLSRDSFD